MPDEKNNVSNFDDTHINDKAQQSLNSKRYFLLIIATSLAAIVFFIVLWQAINLQYATIIVGISALLYLALWQIPKWQLLRWHRVIDTNSKIEPKDFIAAEN